MRVHDANPRLYATDGSASQNRSGCADPTARMR
jgi:hypothetical protein